MLNRRSFLRNLPAAGVAITAPAAAVAETKGAPSPDERIDAALAEIVMGLRERYPDCPIRILDIDNFDSGTITIVTHCGNDQPGTVDLDRRKGRPRA